ncbi:MAG TPA: C1 family peptidase [Chitinophagales bacterium]|nr:C1 family peptidase [Chitinophagales bacterium]HRK29172.1 C1 family peptidase [Chitinophagales bacterium]
MKKITQKFLLPLAFIAGLFMISPGCDEESVDEIINLLNSLGWLQPEENLNQIATDINLSQGGNVPSAVDLAPKFPPIGDQGQYGTCVGWSVGYNLKTVIEGIDQNFTTSQLAQASRQFSPKDLFWAVSNSNKGADCNGTTFEAAFDVMQARGIATMATVPYQNLGNCSSNPQSAWTTEANNFKITNYRKIDPDVNTIRGYLAQGRPVAIGVRVGDNFLKWNSTGVLTSDTYGYTGQHAYHAVAVAGYDDNKGPNGAFKVVNSWGPQWGNSGYIWIDYYFFQNSFCFSAFVANNKRADFAPDADGDNQVDDGNIISGTADLIAWDLYDYDDDPTDLRTRTIFYNVYNMGDRTIYSSERWNIVYIYYNAYDANEWGILLYDYYTNEYDNANHNGPLTQGPGLSGNWWNNINVPGGSSVAHQFGSEGFLWDYTVPGNLNGYYYMALVADGYDDIQEHNESNNYYYFTDDNDAPLYIQNGIIDDPNGKRSAYNQSKRPQNPPSRKGEPSPAPSVVREGNLNAYTTAEIRQMIQHHKQTGELQRRIQQFNQQAQNRNKKRM